MNAEGYLSIIEGTVARRSDVRFTLNYEFVDNRIIVKINSGRKMLNAEMYTSEKEDKISVRAIGFDGNSPVKTGGEIKYLGTHGEIENVKLHKKRYPCELGYEIVIK